MWFSIDPLDVWLFREGKPFSAGEVFHAASVFPPSGRTMLGALRATVLVRNGIAFREYHRELRTGTTTPRIQEIVKRIGSANDLGPLRARGPFVKRGKDVFFPMPLDLCFRRSKTVEYLTPRCAPLQIECSPFQGADGTQVKLPMLPFLRQAATHEADRLLRGNQLQNYLWHEHVDVNDTVPAADLWQTEPRTGIKLGASRTAEEGMFYTVDFIRTAQDERESTGLLLEVRGLEADELDATGLIALGGERRAAAYRTHDKCPDALAAIREGTEIRDSLEGKKGFRLYLASPAVFPRNGWFPDFLKIKAPDDPPKVSLHGSKGVLKLKLVAAVVGKPIHQAGWDLVNRRPRAVRKAVPAGSVYYLRKIGGALTSDDCELVMKIFHFTSLLRRDCSRLDARESELSEDGKAGLGLSLVGCCPER